MRRDDECNSGFEHIRYLSTFVNNHDYNSTDIQDRLQQLGTFSKTSLIPQRIKFRGSMTILGAFLRCVPFTIKNGFRV